MRRANLDVLPVAVELARDTDAGVRREVALSLRDQPADKALPSSSTSARLRRPGSQLPRSARTGATGKEPALYEQVRKALGVKDDPLTWSPAFTWIVWRLHSGVSAGPDRRAQSPEPRLLTAPSRMDTLAFTSDDAAAKAMLALAAPTSALRDGATYWLLNRLTGDWASLISVRPQDRRHLRSGRDRAEGSGHSAAERRSADAVDRRDRWASRAMPRAERKPRRAARCATTSAAPAPSSAPISTAGAGQVVRSHRHGDRRSQRRSGVRLRRHRAQDEGRPDDQGVVIKQGDPLMMRSMGGVTQIIPADRVATGGAFRDR